MTLTPQTIWTSLEELPSSDLHQLIKTSDTCIPDLCLGVSPEGKRCLVLRLPPDFAYGIHPFEGEAVTLKTLSSDNYIVLTLLDQDYHDLFDDVIVSIYNSVEQLADPNVYTASFIRTFSRWARFFHNTGSGEIPHSVIQGLFGELVYLQWLLSTTGVQQVNGILQGWRGPYDRGHDFILDDRHVEVKSRIPANNSVRIESEDQLDQRNGKRLELSVVVLDPGDSSGRSLGEIIRQISDEVATRLGDVSILYEALSQKNLFPGNLAEYDTYTFAAKEIVRHDVLGEPDFPRLVRGNLPDAVSRVRYTLNTSELVEHEIERIVL